jgi:VWFA-related protein
MGQQFVESQFLSAQRRAIFSVISVHSVVNIFLALLLVFGWLGVAPVQTSGAQGKEKSAAPPAQTAAPGVIKSESSVVLVDVIVTDKKGNYLQDTKQGDFHVFEDGAEQPLTSFSRESDIQPGAPERPRYMVLLFDDTGLDATGQTWEREAAEKFVEGTPSSQEAQGRASLEPRMMAVLDYDRGLYVAQNFTTDKDLLVSAIRKTNFSATQTNIPALPWQKDKLGSVSPPGGLLQALRDVAGTLATAPGRKTLLFFSTGSSLTSRRPSDFQDTVDALNKANAGVYTLSPGGLDADMNLTDVNLSFRYKTQQEGMEVTESMGGTTPKPESLPKLALQTGGFPIVNTNGLARGMEKASGEMNEYYLLGYVPPSPVHDGRYHKIQVKVDRAGAEVRARTGYADTKSPDLLAGKTEGVALEAKATNSEAGQIPVNLRTPYFYVRPGVARVNLAWSIPGSAIEFEKQKDNFQSQINVVGIAYRDDGSVAARFSDKVHLDYDKDEKETAAKSPFNYQNSLRIAAGDYTFKLVVSAGGSEFGKYVKPIIVDPFTGKQFTLSGPAFGDRVVASPLNAADIDQGLSQGKAPMVAGGMQVVPSSSNHFQQGAQPVVYVEVYDPLLESSNPQMGVLFDIVNWKNNQKVYTSNTLPINEFAHPGNPLVPVIFKLPIEKLPAGNYGLEVWARDSDGDVSSVRTADFSVD